MYEEMRPSIPSMHVYGGAGGFPWSHQEGVVPPYLILPLLIKKYLMKEGRYYEGSNSNLGEVKSVTSSGDGGGSIRMHG